MRLNLSVLALAAAAFLGLASVSEAGIWTKQTPMQTVAPPTVTAETLASFTANKLGSTCPHTGAYIAPNEALWFTQLADHFAHDSTATWQQKYYMNDAYAAASSPESPPPVHVYIGSEGPLSPNYLMSGLVHDAAKAHSARMVALEHRFYGDSKPTADLSPASLRLLSSQQALADLAAFLTAMGYTDRSKNGPITVWGGSYGGSLSAWFRLKYPHIAIASLASSAPLEPEVAFYQYYEVVEDALTEFGGATCVSNIRKALVTVEQKLQGGDAAALADDFLLCTAPPSGTSPARADVLARETFFYSLTDRVADIIQYHKDAAAQNIVTLCKDLATQASPYAGLASSMREWLRLRGSKCIDHSYADMVASMNSTRWGNGMMRQWTWQTCTEFGFYQVTGKALGHAKLVSPSLFYKLCADVFGLPDDNGKYVLAAAQTARNHYGGFVFSASNTYFTNGGIDPWKALSKLPGVEPIAEGCETMVTARTSHCAILGTNTASTLAQDRLTVIKRIGQWIGQDYKEQNNKNAVAAIEESATVSESLLRSLGL